MKYAAKDVFIRNVTNEDLKEVCQTWRIAEPDRDILSPENASELISRMKANEEKNSVGCIWHICLAICEKPSGTIVGWCGLDGTRGKDGPDIFYLVGKPFRNRGIATQSGMLLLHIAFQEFHVPVVYGGCHRKNIASFHVLRKIGLNQYDHEQNCDPLFRITADEYAIKDH